MKKIFRKVLAGLSIVFVFFMMQAGPAFGSYSLTRIYDLDRGDKNEIVFQRNRVGRLQVGERLAEPGEVPLATVPKLANKPHYAPIKDCATLTVNEEGKFFDSMAATAFYLRHGENLTIDWKFLVKSGLVKDPGIVGYGFEFYTIDLGKSIDLSKIIDLKKINKRTFFDDFFAKIDKIAENINNNAKGINFDEIDESINITSAGSNGFPEWEFEDGLLDFYDSTFEYYVDTRYGSAKPHSL